METQAEFLIHLIHGLYEILLCAPILLLLAYQVWNRGTTPATSWLLMAGAGWFATGLTSITHGILATNLIDISTITHLSPTSWFAERATYALAMVVAYLVYLLGGFNVANNQAKRALLVVLGLGALIFATLILLLVPNMYFDYGPIHRPLDAALAPVFLALAIAWRHNRVMRSSMIFATLTQLCMMTAGDHPVSFVLSEMFVFAHVLKIIDYALPLVLLRSTRE